MSSLPTEALVDVVLPAMGTSVTEGTVIGWSKAVGDAVAVDETICEVSTDKVDTECPSPAGGVLAEILVAVGETVEVGTVLARLATSGAAPAPVAAPAPARAAPVNGASAAGDRSNGRARRYSPIVRRMSAAHGIDPGAVPGSGQGGRVTKRDVLAYLEREPEERPMHSESPYRPEPAADAPPAPPAAAPTELGGHPEPLSRIRQAIGGAMRRSQETAATCHTVVECDMTRVETRRRELGTTALPLVARAVVDVLRGDFALLNSTLDGTTLTRYERVHLGIAVSLGDEGLIVPVIHDAQDLAPEGLAARIKDLATRARTKQLRPDEVQGATFTITNPGRSGAIIATPIVNVPQVAILDIEAIVRRPVVLRDAEGNESIGIRPMVNLVLGWDHRAIDGVYAAEFLTAVRAGLERL
jgi:pyruvate/2-oxoglutarate dehydrogenase complex dihydrolipoamide acyltransferase (E2) component